MENPMSRYLFLAILLLHLNGATASAGSDSEVAALQQEVEHYQALLQEGKEQAKAFNGLGFAYYRLHRLPEALDAYQQAIVANPGYALAYNNLGAAHLTLKEYVQGEAAFRQALQLDPTWAKAAFNLAVVLYRQNRYLDAYMAYCTARKLDGAYVKERFDKTRAKEELQGKLRDDPDNSLLLLALKRLDDE